MFFQLLLIICLHHPSYLASYIVTPILWMPSFITSLNLFRGLPCFPLPRSSKFSILCPTYPLFHAQTISAVPLFCLSLSPIFGEPQRSSGYGSSLPGERESKDEAKQWPKDKQTYKINLSHYSHDCSFCVLLIVTHNGWSLTYLVQMSVFKNFSNIKSSERLKIESAAKAERSILP